MKTFEEYLKEKHAETYMGTDDSMPEAFSDWLSILSVDDLIIFADEYKNLAEQSLVQRVLEALPENRYYAKELTDDNETPVYDAEIRTWNRCCKETREAIKNLSTPKPKGDK